MKLSSTLLQAITLGVSVTAVTAATTSCEKIKQNKEQVNESRTSGTDSNQTHTDPCPACGMG